MRFLLSIVFALLVRFRQMRPAHPAVQPRRTCSSPTASRGASSASIREAVAAPSTPWAWAPVRPHLRAGRFAVREHRTEGQPFSPAGSSRCSWRACAIRSL